MREERPSQTCDVSSRWANLLPSCSLPLIIVLHYEIELGGFTALQALISSLASYTVQQALNQRPDGPCKRSSDVMFEAAEDRSQGRWKTVLPQSKQLLGLAKQKLNGCAIVFWQFYGFDVWSQISQVTQQVYMCWNMTKFYSLGLKKVL